MNTLLKVELDDAMIDSAKNTEMMATQMITDSVANGVPVANKLLVCSMAVRKLLEGKEVSKEEMTGLLDSVGGYYMGVVKYCENHGGTPKQMKFAESLLHFAIRLQDLTRSAWGLTIIDGGKK